MTDELSFSISSIVIFVFILNSLTKYVLKTIEKESWYKYIPVCSLVYGVILGIAGYFIPDIEMGKNIVEAIFIGLAAGTGTTGIHQLYKQQTKIQEENKKE